MATFPRASVIVVGFNSSRWLSTCLSSLASQEYPSPYEILFVDNKSSDGSLGIAHEQFPSVRVIASDKNRGYAGGNNLGAESARGEILAFVNPDTLADSHWLLELVRPFTESPNIGLTTSKIVLMDQPDVVNACGNDISLSGITTCHRAGEPSSHVTHDEDIAAVSGAAFAIRADLFAHLGGFDERFWMYLEETDLSWRAHLAGYRCVLAARSVIRHHYRFQLSPSKTWTIERNRYLMLAKNLNPVSLLALTPQLLAGEILAWGWAMLNGWEYVRAKTSAMAWLFTNSAEIWRTHRSVQSQRVMSDKSVLSTYLVAPAVSDINGGPVGRLAQLAITPILMFVAIVSFTFISLFSHEIDIDARTFLTETHQETGRMN